MADGGIRPDRFGMLPLMPFVREPVQEAPAGTTLPAGTLPIAPADATLRAAAGQPAGIGLDPGASLPPPTDLTAPVSTPAPKKLQVKKRRKRGKRKGRPIDGAKMDALEAAFGPWKGIGRNKNPRESTGPNGNRLLESAAAKLAAGDCEGAKKDYEKAKKTASPIMLDLNHDGKLGTTGVSTAKDRIDGQVGRTVDFDLDGDGKKEKVEWASGSGDGFLIDDSDGGATRAMVRGEDVDGKRLFGDEGGKYANGYEKLKKFDKDGDGELKGDELKGLKMWVDNGDATLAGGELRTLDELGITKISVTMKMEKNSRGEDLMRSTFEQTGQTHVSEDVWFAKQ